MGKDWGRRFFLICFLFLNGAWAHAIVFVHIGDALPAHLETAVEQVRLFNRACPVFVVASGRALEGLCWEVTGVAYESLPKTVEHEAFCAARAGQRGFDRVTCERFLYLYDLMEAYELEEVFHLENDNMLYVDVEELLPHLRAHYPHLGVTFDSDLRGIGGFVYVANAKSMQALASFFAEEKGSDMELLSRFRKSGEVAALPIVPATYTPLKNRLGQRAERPADYSNHIEEFHSLFDAAAIGQYLGGGDGFAHWEPVKPGFINETCFFNPSFFQYEWRRDAEGRNIPYAIYRGKAYRINNLHVHSKLLFLFAS